MQRTHSFFLLVIIANVVAGVIVWFIVNQMNKARAQNAANDLVSQILDGR